MSELNIKNKKASFQYEILEKYVAGIQLLGTEIKSTARRLLPIRTARLLPTNYM